jgi:hypothetical protein
MPHLRLRLRHAGTRLITVGNQMAGAQRQRGQVFLTWRRPQSLQIIVAIGRQSPTHGWTPRPLGTEMPFWFREQAQWRRVLPLLRRYEQVRSWCHPRLLRIPGVGEVVLQEIAWLETALTVLQEHRPASLSVSRQACSMDCLRDAAAEESGS